MKAIQYALITGLLISGTLACGSDDSNSGGEDVDAASAQLALREISTTTQANLVAYRALSVEGPASMACDRGGTVNAVGDVQVAVNPVQVDVDVAMDYAGCAPRPGVMIDGGLDFSQQVLVGEEDSLVYVETIFVGTTTVTTDDRAITCDIDVNVVVDLSGALVSVDGNACGHAASELDITVMPHWQG